jgi:hypothetical protein
MVSTCFQHLFLVNLGMVYDWVYHTSTIVVDMINMNKKDDELRGILELMVNIMASKNTPLKLRTETEQLVARRHLSRRCQFGLNPQCQSHRAH